MTERTVTGDGSGAAPAASADWPTVPEYEILSELGRGGMGVVYKARQVSSNRLVALKLIRDGALAGPQERARFRVEAEAAARMRHPNIVLIHEVGEQQGLPYFAMELVEGGSLDTHLNGRPLPAPTAAELTRTLALAVEHAHGQHVVHRDLKPANILLVAPTEAGGAWVPKVTDFGLAKRLDSQSTALTQDGAVLGTVSYMAPEQAAGRVRDIGPAVDVYALGAVLYEMLTGRPPFLADSWNRMLEQVLNDEPDPPSRLQPGVPRDLETVCLKCLEKEPARRYASAAELAADLGRFLAGSPLAAEPPGESDRLFRLAARDGFQIVEEVGRGPRATVYRARHGPLRQPVALKVFRPGTRTREEWDAHLRRGADLWPGLAHPLIVPVHRGGWWDGAAYLATEYVPQGSLANKLAGRPYPVREALRLVEQLADVVSYLHRQGAVHGNLKPSNVLLAADGIPRVTDFLTAGGLPPSEADPGRDLRYLAPELVGTPDAQPRPNTDIYGLGLILYELLAGRPPFDGASSQEILDQVRSREPAAPSRLNAAVTPQLDAVCLQCLRKNPWRRFSRAYDLATRLRQVEED